MCRRTLFPTTTHRSSNPLGIAGFVISILGILSCGLLAPLGLLLSGMAMFRRPRGLATAGTVLGGMASLWLVVLAGGLMATAVSRHDEKCSRRERAHNQTTLQAVTQAAREVSRYKEEHGDWPDPDVGQTIVGKHDDAYGTPIRYTRVAEMVLILSAGADREFATPDDVSLDPPTGKQQPTTPINLDD